MNKAFVLILAVAFCALSCGVALAADKPAEKAEASQITPKKAQIDTNMDGKPDRVEYYDDKGQVTKVEADADYDGVMDESITYENGKPVKSTRDTNKDGKPDVWVDF